MAQDEHKSGGKPEWQGTTRAPRPKWEGTLKGDGTLADNNLSAVAAQMKGGTRFVRRDKARRNLGLPRIDADKEFRELMATTTTPTQTAAARPLLTVYSVDGKATSRRIALPDVMLTPIRNDVVSEMQHLMLKNARQPYACQNQENPHGKRAGMEVAAKSWGTGRAVSRIPRVKGGGTHRAGQGAYANMCRGGRMFAPTKVWRKWHRKINVNQRRHAVCSAIAASAVPALVMARGHRIDRVPEIPLIVEDDFQKIRKTKVVQRTLRNFNLHSELRRCEKRTMRPGKGKSRNRRWKRRTGPLIVFAKDNNIVYGCRNLPGVDYCSVYSLNLLKLAPGGHLGRMIVWTEGAVEALTHLYGSHTKGALLKKKRNGQRYHPPRAMMKNSDLQRIIMSPEIQAVVRPKRTTRKHKRKRDPLRVPEVMAELNPDFAEEWVELKKDRGYDKVGKCPKPRADTLMRNIRKRRKTTFKPFNQIEMKLSDAKKYEKYWSNVFGDDNIFKNKKLLAAEKKAVTAAIAQQEREKQGLDLLDMLRGVENDDE